MKVLESSIKSLASIMERKTKIVDDKKITIFKVKSKDYSYKSLTEEEMEIANKIFRLYADLPAGALSKLSHLDPPYLAAEPQKPVDFKFVFYRKDAEADFEESLPSEEQLKIARDISVENLNKFFDYVHSTSP